MLLFVVAVALSLLFSFVCSLSEATLLSVSHARIEALAQAGSQAGRLLRRFRREPDRPIAAILVLNTVANSGGAAIATGQFAHAFPGASPELFAAAFVVAVLTLTEIVPKTIGVVHANGLAVPVAHVVHWMALALAPVLFFTRQLSRLVAKAPGQAGTSLDDIRVLTALGVSSGAFGTITATLIQNATRLRETKARDVMVPRDRIAFLSGTASTEANLRRVRDSGHSRFPFTPTGELDHVNGVILTKELLFSLRERTEPDWRQLSIPSLIVPATATLNHVLRRFQRAKRHLAIVVDEYGSTRGLLTLEDVLEEIVGEIEDESDTDESNVQERADGSLVCRGIAELAPIVLRLGIPPPDTASKTLSGFLAERLGTVPTPGAQLELGEWLLTVTKANNRRAERIRISRQTGGPAPAASAPPDAAGDAVG
jgi:CBS domain containing-hemolysin-like protein